MKPTIYILGILFICFSCNTNIDEEQDSTKSTQNQETIIEPKTQELNVDKPVKTDSMSIKKYGQLILDNKVEPSDNEQTFRCLQNLVSKDENEREFYFHVYEVIAKKSDGALSEVIGGYLKASFELFPDFFLLKFKNLDKQGKKIFLDNLAFEFYASKPDYETFINECFAGIDKKLNDRSEDNLKLIQDIKNKVIKRAKEMDEK